MRQMNFTETIRCQRTSFLCSTMWNPHFNESKCLESLHFWSFIGHTRHSASDMYFINATATRVDSASFGSALAYQLELYGYWHSSRSVWATLCGWTSQYWQTKYRALLASAVETAGFANARLANCSVQIASWFVWYTCGFITFGIITFCTFREHTFISSAYKNGF